MGKKTFFVPGSRIEFSKKNRKGMQLYEDLTRFEVEQLNDGELYVYKQYGLEK